MEEYCRLIQCFVWGFFLTLLVSPFVISFIKKEKVKQVILNYVEEHKGKAGTPTMGGIIFLIAIPIVVLICSRGSKKFTLAALIIFLAYGLIGFLDDFLKFKNKRNLGLKAYQKIILQLAVALGIGFFVYYSDILGGELIIPFSSIKVDIGWWIIPLVAIIYLATTNSVNLTDGLDGLASSTTLTYMLSFVLLVFVLANKVFIGENETFLNELYNINLLSSVTAGTLLCFLSFNCFPAKIFMGDTGSLSLGSLVASVAVFSKLGLYIPIIGIMFVASSVSVILQVAYYKLTKRRIFLMSPLHHHFQKKGVHEVRITMCYALVTAMIGLITVILNILL